MKSKLLVALAFGGLLAGTSLAFAQSAAGPASPSGGAGDATKNPASMTEEDVNPSSPWGEMTIDMSADLNSSGLTNSQFSELRQRCDIIVANPSRYDASYVTYCQTNQQGLSGY
jgi:hypothetical protein